MKLSRIIYCLTLAVLMPDVMYTKTIINNNETWIEHNARVARFVCSVPQPRSFGVNEIIQDQSLRTTAGAIFPHRTVLFRCEHAGCCRGIKRCLPHKIDEVELIFAISTPDRRPNIRYVQIKALNHTECSCQNRKDKPK